MPEITVDVNRVHGIAVDDLDRGDTLGTISASSAAGGLNGTPKCGCEIAGDADVAERIGPVPGDVEVEQDVVDHPERLHDRHAERRIAGRIRIPLWSTPRPSSSAEQSMPSDGIPRIGRGSITRPSGITVPAVASGIDVARCHVERPTPHVEPLARTGIDEDLVHLLGLRMALCFEHPAR